MNLTTLRFETSEFLVVRDGEKVRFRCPIHLTDLGNNEPLGTFVDRKGGLESAVSYLRQLLNDDMRRIMRMPIK
jgi:hypothetical protein